jgi:hypothetical protein
MPAVGVGTDVGSYQVGDGVYLTLLEDDQLQVMEWADGAWRDVPFAAVASPDGVRFVADTDILVPGEGGSTYVSRPSMVVLRDGSPITVGSPDRASSGMVTLGGVIYGLSHETAGHVLWRSTDGVAWERADTPISDSDDPLWAYLTAGHGRLMLTIGLEDGDAIVHRLMTSLDGSTWVEVDIPKTYRHPVVPQATDFGWMMTTPGLKDEGGLYGPNKFSVLLSDDGLRWANYSGTFDNRTGWSADPNPLVYQSGLFVRGHFSGVSTEVWRIVSEQ